MSLSLILFYVYIVVAIGFFIAIFIEGKDHFVPIHAVIAILWPIWTMFFLYVIIADKISLWRANRKK